MNKMKKILLISLSCAIFLLAPFTTYASEAESITKESVELSVSESLLRNTNIKYNTLSLSFSNGKANCSASITGYTFVTSVKITMNLYKKNGSNWDKVDSWESSSNSNYLYLSGSAAASAGTYKLVGVFTANGEEITKEVEQSN